MQPISAVVVVVAVLAVLAVVIVADIVVHWAHRGNKKLRAVRG